MSIRRLLCAFTWHSWVPVSMIEPWLIRVECSFCGCKTTRTP
jgi:hypothetical protein